jgi:hypothetical protein
MGCYSIQIPPSLVGSIHPVRLEGSQKSGHAATLWTTVVDAMTSIPEMFEGTAERIER